MATPTIGRIVLPPAEPLGTLVATFDGFGAGRPRSGSAGEHLGLAPEVASTVTGNVRGFASTT